MRANTLRRTKPLERDIQAGVLKLLDLMPEVAWAYKVAVGEWVVVRPHGELGVRKQLQVAVNAGMLKSSQIGYIQGAPEGVLDINLQLSGSCKHCELEVKQPGEKPTEAQLARINLIRHNGGLADWVNDIDQVQPLVMQWRKY